MAAGKNALITQIIKEILKKIGVGASSIWAVVLNYGGQYLYDFLVDAYAKMVRKKEQEEALKKLEEAQASLELTPEERAKAYEDAINAGRK